NYIMKAVHYRALLFVFSVFTVLGQAWAQGTAADYRRAEAFGETTRNKVYYAPSNFSWLENQQKFWYVHSTPEGKRFMLVDAAKQQKEEAFDHGKLAAALAVVSNEAVDADSLPFNSISYKGAEQMEFDAFGKVWSVS